VVINLEKRELRPIVRLMATDIKGELPLARALRNIKGIGFMFSSAVCRLSGVDPKKKIGLLDSKELKAVEEAIKNPDVPSWLKNRRKDMETGADIHITGTEVDLKKREDINLLRKIRAYKGIRHELGLPVRGQRTRSSFRKNKAIGVRKKKKGGK
jgi:small subunit ribosomal protein S13